MALSGILVIDKPAGMTSHDVVMRVRKKLGLRRVGHAGTLDPEVTGVLVVCVGEATRLIEYITADEKVYEGTVRFGIGTDTDDGQGNVTAKQSAIHLTDSDVITASKAFVGAISQRVPAYSAVHINGKRAYEYARDGAVVELPVRTVYVHHMDVSNFHAGEVAEADFRIACSKGTYVRAICRDWGELLGLPAHMAALRRTASGRYTIEDATGLSHWEASTDPAGMLLPPVQGVRHLPQVIVDAEVVKRLANGQIVTGSWSVEPNAATAVLNEQGQLAAIVSVLIDEIGRISLKPSKVFLREEA